MKKTTLLLSHKTIKTFCQHKRRVEKISIFFLYIHPNLDIISNKLCSMFFKNNVEDETF
jgi:hypothetical protein